ncbi:hypothetical protein R50076_03940 [Gilvimarinus japonicus]
MIQGYLKWGLHEDCAIEEPQVESSDGKTEKSKLSITADSEGNMFGLYTLA